MESSKPDLPNLLKEHALGKQMLNDDPEAFARDLVLDIPVPDRAENFTTGTCKEAFVPSILVSRKTRTMLAVFFIGAGATGHRGFVHGGVLATILDECCGRAAQSQFEAVKLARGKLIRQYYMCNTTDVSAKLPVRMRRVSRVLQSLRSSRSRTLLLFPRTHASWCRPSSMTIKKELRPEYLQERRE